MKFIFYDLVRADEIVNSKASVDTSFKRDKELIKYYKQVFTIHKVTKDQFYKSYRYYQTHPDVNKVLFDSLASFAGSKRALVETK